MAKSSSLNIIIITGAESTGKTELAKQLAAFYNVKWIPELARSYVEQLNRPYTYADVEQIAKSQIEQFKMYVESKSEPVFFDTGLVITKVWFDVVYKKCPEYLIKAIAKLPKFFHLLCDTDLPWHPDSVRENGGEMRKKLSEMYKKELTNFDLPYQVVKGVGEQRLNHALSILNEFGIK